jgi:hypothetical protein
VPPRCAAGWGVAMSVRVMSKVWEGYPGESGPELLVMLALADWCDDEGRCFPSIAALGKKCRVGRSQTQRIIHRLINGGLVAVTDNANGGAPGSSRRYKINLDRLTGSENATGRRNATGSENAPEGSQKCAERGSENATLTIIEPSLTISKGNAQVRSPSSAGKKKKNETTLSEFLEACNIAGQMPIPDGDSIFEYAAKVGINQEMLAVCWQEFKTRHTKPITKRQKDWRSHFHNAVKRNWYHLWFLKAGEDAQWTTAGEQARRAVA